MKIGFTGDLYLGDIQKYTSNPFKNIANDLIDMNLVVNLESIALPIDYSKEPIKDKICLKQNFNELSLIRELNPFLVNLSNNHINDYGNSGVDFTKKRLESDGFNYFGAGYFNNDHNIFVFEKDKLVFLSYTSRETDQSGSKLFNEKNFQGPKEFSLELFKNQISKYKDYKKIILIHWGIECFKYPLPFQRELAYRIIDLGGDLLIGNHAHVIQGYEEYAGKYIFYSLGNFIFPHIKRNLLKTFYQEKRNKESIIPIFIIEDKIKLERVIEIKADRNFELNFTNFDCNFNNKDVNNVNLDAVYYKKFYKREYRKFKIIEIVRELLRILYKIILYIKN